MDRNSSLERDIAAEFRTLRDKDLLQPSSYVLALIDTVPDVTVCAQHFPTLPNGGDPLYKMLPASVAEILFDHLKAHTDAQICVFINALKDAYLRAAKGVTDVASASPARQGFQASFEATREAHQREVSPAYYEFILNTLCHGFQTDGDLMARPCAQHFKAQHDACTAGSAEAELLPGLRMAQWAKEFLTSAGPDHAPQA